MKIRISTTDAARNLGEHLARIRHGGARFILTRNGQPVAELGPVPGSSSATLAELWTALRDVRADDEFADDLERVNQVDSVLEDPWR